MLLWRGPFSPVSNSVPELLSMRSRKYIDFHTKAVHEMKI